MGTPARLSCMGSAKRGQPSVNQRRWLKTEEYRFRDFWDHSMAKASGWETRQITPVLPWDMLHFLTASFQDGYA